MNQMPGKQIVNPNSLKTKCGCLHGRVIENGHTHDRLTLWTVRVCVHVCVWVHILCDPQSVQLRGTTTATTPIMVKSGKMKLYPVRTDLVQAASFQNHCLL